jgi:hypothetical protein
MIECVLLCLVFIGTVHTQVMNSIKTEPDYYRYLQQFGYTPRVEGRRLFSVLAKSSYADGILKLQRLYKLPVSSCVLFRMSQDEHSVRSIGNRRTR